MLLNTRSQALPVAVEPLITMGGQSGSLLVKDTTGQLWVLKLRWNPQHERVAVNEYLGHFLAHKIGVTVPESTLMRLGTSHRWVEVLPKECPNRNLQAIHFATRFVGGRWPGLSCDKLSSFISPHVLNQAEFAGILALDVWLGNTDRRQAVFVRKRQTNLLQAHWIDFGNCFGASSWRLSNGSKMLFPNGSAYNFIRSMNDFQPWIERIHRVPLSELLHPSQISAWTPLTSGDDPLEGLLMQLAERRKHLYSKILEMVYANLPMFPCWE